MYTNTRFCRPFKRFATPRFFEKTTCVQLHADKHCQKGFKTWDQLIALMYAQISLGPQLRRGFWGGGKKKPQGGLNSPEACTITTLEPALSGVQTLGRCQITSVQLLFGGRVPAS